MSARMRSIWLAMGGLSILAWASAAPADGPARRVEIGRQSGWSATRVERAGSAGASPSRVVKGHEVRWGDCRVRRLKSEADIEGLKADLRWNLDRWELRVSYKVEIEDLRPWERFEIAFRVAEGGIPLLDECGRPLTITIPLDCPSAVDDDELEFRDSFVLELPDEAVLDAHNLRVHAKVVRLNDGKVLDRAESSVRCLSHRPVRVIVRNVRRVEVVRHTSVTVHRTMRFSRSAVGRTVVRQVPVVPVAVPRREGEAPAELARREARPPVTRPAAPVVSAGSGVHVGVGVSVRR